MNRKELQIKRVNETSHKHRLKRLRELQALKNKNLVYKSSFELMFGKFEW